MTHPFVSSTYAAARNAIREAKAYRMAALLLANKGDSKGYWATLSQSDRSLRKARELRDHARSLRVWATAVSPTIRPENWSL